MCVQGIQEHGEPGLVVFAYDKHVILEVPKPRSQQLAAGLTLSTRGAIPNGQIGGYSINRTR